ncbi:peptidoglycan binding protein CsiV [Gammaproteobacteria bacterium]|nr:peptidoglycan binding protein CsiV [Gammaproteobacteria bacterium]
MTYFKQLLIMVLAIHSTGSSISTESYDVELIIFEHKKTQVNENFDSKLVISETEVLKFRKVDLYLNENSFNIEQKDTFFSKIFSNLKIEKTNINNTPSKKIGISNPKEWFRKDSKLIKLKNYENKLKNSKKYKLLESISWKQNIPYEKDSKFLEYENVIENYGFLLKLYRGRFLHVDLKAYLGNNLNRNFEISDLTEAYIKNSSLELVDSNNQNIELDINLNLNKKNDYIKLKKSDDLDRNIVQERKDIKIFIDEKRRVFNEDVHYFDHPRFGIILYISKDD